MKKLMIMICILTLIVSMTACNNAKIEMYNLAVEKYSMGDYQTAKALFEQTLNYKNTDYFLAQIEGKLNAISTVSDVISSIDTKSEVMPSSAITSDPEVTKTPVKVITKTPTKVPTIAPTKAPTKKPTPTLSPKPKNGTRLSPLSLNQPIIFNGLDEWSNSFKIELTLMEVIRGEDALNMAKQGNQFNSTPPSGKEYLFAKFKIRAIESKNDESIDISSAKFDLYSTNGVEYDDFVVVSGLEYEFTEIFAPAETFGYAYYYVNINDINPTIVFLSYVNQGIWFKTN